MYVFPDVLECLTSLLDGLPLGGSGVELTAGTYMPMEYKPLAPFLLMTEESGMVEQVFRTTAVNLELVCVRPSNAGDVDPRRVAAEIEQVLLPGPHDTKAGYIDQVVSDTTFHEMPWPDEDMVLFQGKVWVETRGLDN